MSRDAILCMSAILLSILLAWRTNDHLPMLEVSQEQERVVDASGYAVVAAPYQRIAAVSTVASQVLPDLVALDRLVLVSQWYHDNHHQAFRTAHIPRVAGSDQIEAIVAARPDLVLINNFQMQPAVVQRLRSLGLNVFDLGALDGPPSLLRNIRDLGAVLQEGERGTSMAERLQWRLKHLAADIAPEQRRRAMVLNRYGDQTVGATKGSSYHWLLHYAGLQDVASEQGLPPWPVLESEQILLLRPEVIITGQGQTQGLRSLPGLRDLELQFVELPSGYDSTGPDILELSEWVFRHVYGSDGRDVHRREDG